MKAAGAYYPPYWGIYDIEEQMIQNHTCIDLTYDETSKSFVRYLMISPAGETTLILRGFNKHYIYIDDK